METVLLKFRHDLFAPSSLSIVLDGENRLLRLSSDWTPLLTDTTDKPVFTPSSHTEESWGHSGVFQGLSSRMKNFQCKDDHN